MKRLHLVRHGPTHARGFVGWSDLPADLGDTAAVARLSDHLPGNATIVSSDLVRASATADAIQQTRRRLPHDPALREINFGNWELRRHPEIEAEDPELARAYWERPGDVRPPGGESWNQVRARVDAAVDGLLRDCDTADLIIVAHFGVILTQVQRALSLDADQAFSHRIDNLSVTGLTYLRGVWQVDHVNLLP